MNDTHITIHTSVEMDDESVNAVMRKIDKLNAAIDKTIRLASELKKLLDGLPVSVSME